MRSNALRALWASGRSALNGWLAVPNSFSAEVMGHQGWDTLTIDMQHGLIDEGALVSMLQALQSTPAMPVVRVPWLSPAPIMKVLDAGAQAIICPMVNTADDARKLVQYTRYAPQGGRSFGPVRAGLVHGGDYATAANADTIVFAMIETKQALDNLDAICAVDGIDAVYIGPSDLSLSMGCKPVFDDVDPPVAQAIDHILARAHAHGRKAGVHNGRTDVARARIAKGFDFVTVSSDARILIAGSQQIVKEMKA
jgi:4-hydroxy-2-oxoheptanedioate aldolase